MVLRWAARGGIDVAAAEQARLLLVKRDAVFQ
jgi:hypothetical protein